MAFEHLSLLSEVTTEDGAQYAIITAITAGATWISFNLIKPWFTDWLESRKLDREAARKRENDLVNAQIEDLKQKRADERENNDKTMLAMETRGARETSHIQALNAVAAGQIKFENEILKFLRDTRGAMKAVLRKLDEDFDFEGEDDEVPTKPADGKPAPG